MLQPRRGRRTVGLDHAIARNFGAAIDAKYPHCESLPRRARNRHGEPGTIGWTRSTTSVRPGWETIDCDADPTSHSCRPRGVHSARPRRSRSQRTAGHAAAGAHRTRPAPAADQHAGRNTHQATRCNLKPDDPGGCRAGSPRTPARNADARRRCRADPTAGSAPGRNRLAACRQTDVRGNKHDGAHTRSRRKAGGNTRPAQTVGNGAEPQRHRPGPRSWWSGRRRAHR